MASSDRSKALAVGIATLAVMATTAFFVVRKRSEKDKESSQNITEVSFPSADQSCQIYGNLSVPSRTVDENNNAQEVVTKMPAIVIVAGSGPIDRDGNAQGTKLNTSNRFATHMMDRHEQRGKHPVAVLAYDKRGVGKSVSKEDKNLYHRAGMMDLVADAVEAVRFLQRHPQIDPTRIVVMGHSEGAITLPLVCEKVSQEDGLAPVKGGIFLAGFGENLFDAVALQQEGAIREVEDATGLKGWIMRKFVTKEKVEKQFNDLMTKIESDQDADYVTMYCGLVKIPAKWFREHKKYDEKETHACLAKHMTGHCLAITGQKDVQVRNEFCVPATAQALVPKAASMESHTPPNLTHILRSLEGPARISGVKTDYPRLGKLPLDPELLSLIENWCERVLAV